MGSQGHAVLNLFLVLTNMHASFSSTQVKACDWGWFGSSCQFVCHDMSHCRDMGCCNNNTCLPGYFGPGCQFEDLVHHYKSGSVPTFVYDNDVTTCNPNDSSISLTIKLTSAFVFYWMRITLKDGSSSNLSISVALNQSATLCMTQRLFKVPNAANVLDVTCDPPTVFTNITLTGQLVPNMCSVFISGGRNVALKQITNQSSTLSENVSSKADIDDNTDDVCAIIGNTTKEFWEVRFSRIYILTRVVIPLLENLLLKAYDENNKEVYSFDYRGNSSVAEITVFSHSLKIKKLTITNNSSRSLQLCEVNVFVEIWCPNGYYGLECANKCHCRSDQMCNMVTGACGQGCYGPHNFNCSHSCSRNCSDGTCQPHSAGCRNCRLGYKGRNCSEKCNNKTYGHGCRAVCLLCQSCHHETGDCISCPPGYKGPTCRECQNQYFGINCSQQCSKGCRARECNNVNGICDHCLSGYFGPRCEVCPESHYGRNCSRTCPQGCVQLKCHPETGHCNSCSVGFIECPDTKYGENCSYNCNKQCLPGMCNNVNGTCINCHPGYFGDNCQECQVTTYGLDCASSCSITCLNRNCNHIDGKCFKCVEGHSGDFCPDTTSGSQFLIVLLITGFVVAIIPICYIIHTLNSFLTKQREKRSTAQLQVEPIKVEASSFIESEKDTVTVLLQRSN